MQTTSNSRRLLAVTLFVGALVLAPQTFAGDWGVHLSPGGWGFHYGDHDSHIQIDTSPGYYYQPQPYVYRYQPRPVYRYPSPYYPSGPYYPNYNPVVRRDVDEGAEVAPDGTVHSESRVEDRHASYYSPGRNEAITRPETKVIRRLGPDGVWRSVEQTRWIGADGKPHSTTVERETVQDIWGNTHTNTDVTLKSVKEGAPAETPAKEGEPSKEKPAAGGKEKK